MPGEAHDSDRILSDAKRSLTVQQNGGRRLSSIGRGSAEAKRNHLVGKLKRMAIAVLGILLAAGIAGGILNGIGFAGVMLTALAIFAAIAAFAIFPRMKVPRRSDLNRGDVQQLVSRTELWLEAQRSALPAPAAQMIDRIGVQLDGLGVQLEGIEPGHPAAVETRKLVGEHLPDMVEAYRKIPQHLRREERAGATPDAQLIDSLGKISEEIDSVTRQLADGALDDLAIRTRYLDYRYGVSEDTSPGQS
ncbi:hypothetical protein D6851_10810 [Altericroceibacterium spongiae]|uniref:Uncharacterized protein n=1 Tax=Altericroceibacterium spongiae TaxID=2320269 RepID=A0A420EIS8_9SPHN|nr:hypothetical protein [Altericroceibacterium spongiae]RKF20619.1 hypothetical protein D6851_10810 [Altericroceibacterium spongiae]